MNGAPEKIYYQQGFLRAFVEKVPPAREHIPAVEYTRTDTNPSAAYVAGLEAERDKYCALFLNSCAPIPVSADLADIVTAVEWWVNTRGGEEAVDQIAVMAIQSYQRAALASRPASPDVRHGEALRLDWVAIAKCAGDNGIRYRTNNALIKFLAEIRAIIGG